MTARVLVLEYPAASEVAQTPAASDVRLALEAKRGANVGRDAIDVNVKLVLASSVRGVDGEAHGVAGQFAGQAKVEIVTGGPGRAPIIG